VLEKIEKKEGKKVEQLILTHYHGDHIFGNQVFKDCEIIACNNVNERMKESLENEWTEEKLEEWKKSAEDPSALEGLEIVLPNKLFDDEFEITDNDFSIQIERTGGHTEGSTYTYSPNLKTLVAGDNLFVNRYPWGGDKTADPDKWIETLKKYLALDVEYYVAGHGPIAGTDEVQEFLDYILEVKELMQKMIADNKSEESILKKSNKIKYYPPTREESKQMTLKRWYQVWKEKS
jgi:glyoxylase-like metal-dependent hydrolase (beta-lactamase superfamily II)